MGKGQVAVAERLQVEVKSLCCFRAIKAVPKVHSAMPNTIRAIVLWFSAMEVKASQKRVAFQGKDPVTASHATRAFPASVAVWHRTLRASSTTPKALFRKRSLVSSLRPGQLQGAALLRTSGALLVSLAARSRPGLVLLEELLHLAQEVSSGRLLGDEDAHVARPGPCAQQAW